jgi:hypothetical protein
MYWYSQQTRNLVGFSLPFKERIASVPEATILLLPLSSIEVEPCLEANYTEVRCGGCARVSGAPPAGAHRTLPVLGSLTGAHRRPTTHT